MTPGIGKRTQGIQEGLATPEKQASNHELERRRITHLSQRFAEAQTDDG